MDNKQCSKCKEVKCIDEFYKDDPRFRIVDINYKDSQGACWARNQLQQIRSIHSRIYRLQQNCFH